MTMATSSKHDITCEGESTHLHVTIENEGWSNLQPVSSFFTSRSSRSQFPHHLLRLPRIAITTNETDAPNDDKSKPHPTFDLGLGCFGARPDELTKSADESLIGNQIRTDESSSEEDESYSDDSEPASRISGGSDLLVELDHLEAARPKPEKQRDVMPGDREGIWEASAPAKLNFDSWIDEIAALEASDSMPKGTRYYKVEGSDSTT
ncbi:hypothetical protein F4803DRAFT_523344 [Xylaria telfairii]|nr:hypothetical protein F4803DRAFT_523344 [Xylaria telfairii]